MAKTGAYFNETCCHFGLNIGTDNMSHTNYIGQTTYPLCDINTVNVFLLYHIDLKEVPLVSACISPCSRNRADRQVLEALFSVDEVDLALHHYHPN